MSDSGRSQDSSATFMLEKRKKREKSYEEFICKNS